MAKEKKKEEKKIILERIYNIPLRKKYQRAPRWKRTNRAVKAVREFVLRHMKADEVKIGKYLNLELWKHGIKNPPHHIKVNCKKDEEGIATVELVGAPEERKTEGFPTSKSKDFEEKPKEEPKKKEEEKEEETEIEIREALGEEEKIEKLEEKEKEIKEEKAEKAREIEKEGIKELRKEHPKVHHPPKIAQKETMVDIKKTQSAPERKR